MKPIRPPSAVPPTFPATVTWGQPCCCCQTRYGAAIATAATTPPSGHGLRNGQRGPVASSEAPATAATTPTCRFALKPSPTTHSRAGPPTPYRPRAANRPARSRREQRSAGDRDHDSDLRLRLEAEPDDHSRRRQRPPGAPDERADPKPEEERGGEEVDSRRRDEVP